MAVETASYIDGETKLQKPVNQSSSRQEYTGRMRERNRMSGCVRKIDGYYPAKRMYDYHVWSAMLREKAIPRRVATSYPQC
jgi:hypothetical protein